MSGAEPEEMIVTVHDEDANEEIQVRISTTDYERAIIDSDYLQRLIREAKVSANNSEQTQSVGQGSAEENNPEHLLTPSDENSENIGPSNVFIWQDTAIFLLLALYEERREDFLTKRHKKVFADIARKMKDTNPVLILTGGQCQSKINSLKNTYKNIIDHNKKSGNDRATWPFFDGMNEIFGATGWANPVATASEAGPESEVTSNQPAEITKKKRKLDSILQDYFAEKKTDGREKCN